MCGTTNTWGRQYNRTAANAYALQQEISRDVSETLRTKLTGEQQQQLAKRETNSPEAFQLYLNLFKRTLLLEQADR